MLWTHIAYSQTPSGLHTQSLGSKPRDVCQTLKRLRLKKLDLCTVLCPKALINSLVEGKTVSEKAPIIIAACASF